MNDFDLNILTPRRVFYKGKCCSLVIPTVDGLYGVQAHHRNMVAAVTAGIMQYEDCDGKRFEAAVSRGMIKIEDNEVLVLVESAIRPDEIEDEKLRIQKEEEEDIEMQKKSIRDYTNAESMMARAFAQLSNTDFDEGPL